MRRTLAWLSAFFLVLVAIEAVLLWRASSRIDVQAELAKGLMPLCAAVLVTVLITYALNQRNFERTREAEKTRILTGALQDLKAGFEHASVARYLISAHPTGKRMEEQVETIIKARATLQRMQRERFVLHEDIEDQVDMMLHYLAELVGEYRSNYGRIVTSMAREEALLSEIRQGNEGDLSEAHLIRGGDFPLLAAYLDDDQWSDSAFWHNYDAVKAVLRKRIRELDAAKAT